MAMKLSNLKKYWKSEQQSKFAVKTFPIVHPFQFK